MLTDKVQFIIGNTDYTNLIKNYSLRWDLFQGAGQFTCDLSPMINMHLYNGPVLKFMWKINGYVMMTGYIDTIRRQYAKSANSCTITGRDMMQILLDNYVLKPKSYANKSLKYMIDDILTNSRIVSSIINYSGSTMITKPLSKELSIPYIDVQYTAGAENILTKIPEFKKTKTTHGQSIFDFFSTLCNQVGIFMYNIPGTDTILMHSINPPDGNSLIQYDMNGDPAPSDPVYLITNVMGGSNNNVINCSFVEDITNFYKYIKVIGQAESEELYGLRKNKVQLKIEKIENINNETTSTITIDDLNKGYAGVTKFLCSKINDIDLSAWQKTRNLIINNLLLQQNRKLFSIKYTLANHSPAGSIPYFFNHLALVNDEFLGADVFKNRQFMVYGVEFKGSKDAGLTTDLDLAAPTITNLGQWLRG